MFRYEVHIIEDAEMTTLRDETLYCGDDLDAAKEWARGANYVYGAAILDTEAQTIDWGHAIEVID